MENFSNGVLYKEFEPIEMNEDLIESLTSQFESISEATAPKEIKKMLPGIFKMSNEKIASCENIGGLLFIRADAVKYLDEFDDEIESLDAYLNNKDLYDEESPEYSSKMDKKVSDYVITHIISTTVILITDLYLSEIGVPKELANASSVYIKAFLEAKDRKEESNK